MSRAEQFFLACTSLPYDEIRDERDETSVPELVKLTAKLDDDNPADAIEYGRGLIRHFPDNDLVPTAVGTLLTQQRRPDDVIDLLRTSLAACRRRYRLYSMAGQAEFAINRLANATVWWSRSVIAQCQVVDYQAYLPFYNMAHVALVLEAYPETESFLAMASAIEPRSPHISPSLEERLEPIRQQWIAGPLVRVIEHIDVNYLHGQQ